MSYTPPNVTLPDPVFLSAWSRNSIGSKFRGVSVAQPASGNLSTSTGYFIPCYVTRPYDLQRFWWLNGATVGTDSIQAAIYTVDSSNVLDCLVSGPRTLSAGTANHLQFTTCSVVAHGITSGTNTTDATSFATASVTLKARPGLMYAFSVVNTHGSSANTVTVATTGGGLSFTSRATVQFNGTGARNSLFTAVPTTDVTDTITITIGSAQTATGAAWSLVAFTNVDTATNHGIVQSVTNTGNSTTPSVTLAAFGSASNATFGAHGIANGSGVAPGTGFVEVHDVTYATPATGLETEYRSDNDTGVDATVTSGQWGSIAAEVKSLGTTSVLQPGRYYLALHCTGTTATVFRVASGPVVNHAGTYQQASLTAGLPLTPTLAANAGNLIDFGITSRATP